MSIPARPRLPSSSPLENDTARDFIGGAPGKDLYPWENPSVRSDMLVQLNTKVSETLMLKLEYLLAQDAYSRRRTDARLSKQSIALQAIDQYVNEMLKRAGVPKDRL